MNLQDFQRKGMYCTEKGDVPHRERGCTASGKGMYCIGKGNVLHRERECTASKKGMFCTEKAYKVSLSTNGILNYHKKKNSPVSIMEIVKPFKSSQIKRKFRNRP